jgi:signal transduction histidine kinase
VDPIRVRQVIANLVSNALRHTPAGGSVVVRVAAAPTRAIQIEVRDTGAGMTPVEVAHAFDRFHKGPGSRGSGLGLTIAKNLVAAHGGEIHAASEVGKGTTVTVTLPLSRENHGTA